jgi:radical SAM superfamily enzyme YgiQ (UPF0313 family)
MVCLISAPTVTEFEGAVTSREEAQRLNADYPPVGILSLAAVLELKQISCQVFDINRLFYESVGSDSSACEGGFFSRAARALEDLNADVYGFGTICNSYPLTVRLAREVKRAHPDAVVVFGGPQATAVDLGTLEAFPFIDVVVRGEGEEILPDLLGALRQAEDLAGVAGITFRRNGTVARNPDPPAMTDLDGLPPPAFHLLPDMERRRGVPVEVGRGCPFACTFCSTSQFFRRRFRLVSPARVIEQMQALHRAYGSAEFNLVHDTFTASRAKVLQFCRALAESGCHFKWTCSARTDCVDEELLARMAEAGCTGLFFGVETGSARMQRAIRKNLDLERALAAIRCASANRMRTNVSLIVGFPDETPDDLRDSVAFIMNALSYDHIQPQLQLLAPLAGTPIEREQRARLKWDGLYSDMALQGWQQDPADRALILKHPEIFPNFYGVPNAHLDRGRIMELRDFLTYGMARLRWLVVALDRYRGFLEVLDLWREWRNLRRPEERTDGHYYASDAFRSEFLEFVSSEILADDTDSLAVRTLLEYESQVGRLDPHDARRECPPASDGAPPPAGLGATPHLASGVVLVRLSADYQSVIGCLRDKRPLRDVPRRPAVVAERPLPDGRFEELQLSPLAAALVEVCDGARTIRDIAAFFPRLGMGLDAFPAERACCFALQELARQGLVVFSPATG